MYISRIAMLFINGAPIDNNWPSLYVGQMVRLAQTNGLLEVNRWLVGREERQLFVPLCWQNNACIVAQDCQYWGTIVPSAWHSCK